MVKQFMHGFMADGTSGQAARRALAMLALLSAPVFADSAAQVDTHETGSPAHEQGEQSEHGTAHHGEHGFPHHTIGVFLGDTTETRRNQGLTLGLEYEYRASERFGVGAIIEHVGGDFHTNIAVLPVAYHRGPWKVYAGPGIENSEEEGNTFLVRVGLEYGFHVGKYEVSPQIDVDFVDNEELFIFGVVIARPF